MFSTSRASMYYWNKFLGALCITCLKYRFYSLLHCDCEYLFANRNSFYYIIIRYCVYYTIISDELFSSWYHYDDKFFSYDFLWSISTIIFQLSVSWLNNFNFFFLLQQNAYSTNRLHNFSFNCSLLFNSNQSSICLQSAIKKFSITLFHSFSSSRYKKWNISIKLHFQWNYFTAASAINYKQNIIKKNFNCFFSSQFRF